jgi:DNA-binding NarL/FixJ family response regulator
MSLVGGVLRSVARSGEGRGHASIDLRVRRAVNGSAVPVVVAVASDRSLVADAVSAALSGSNLVIVRVPWPGDRPERDCGWPPGTDPPELALMLCDLDPPSVEAARWVVASHPTRWLLLTDAPRGALWGAMLEAGVARILPSSTSIADLFDIITVLRGGAADDDQRDRDELVEAWRRLQPERAEARARLHSLTQRELEVLEMLHLGHTVSEIAELNGVAPSTVRSQVRSVLRKLGVNSQLAAVAHLERWGGD